MKYANMPKTSLNMLKTIEKRQNLPEKCQRFFGFFCIFLQTKFQLNFLVLKKQKETTMKTSTISQKFLLTPIAFAEL